MESLNPFISVVSGREEKELVKVKDNRLWLIPLERINRLNPPTLFETFVGHQGIGKKP